MRYLVYEGFVSQSQLRVARRAPYADLLRIHPQQHVESLLPPEPRPTRQAERRRALLAAEATLRTLRITAGATLGAARAALLEDRPMVNLGGGFAGTAVRGGSGVPALNDVAVAIAALRASGFQGRIAVIVSAPGDLAGLDECLSTARLSAEMVALSTQRATGGAAAAEGSTDVELRRASWQRSLDELSDDIELAFVLGSVGEAPAGAADEFDTWLGISRERDALLVERCRRTRSVWLPGGLYEKGAWRAFASTLHALAGERNVSVSVDHPSWQLRFRAVAESLAPEVLSGSAEPSWGEVAAELGLRRVGTDRFLGYYTADGIEFVLQRYGVLSDLQRLGYQDFSVEIGRDAQGDRVRLYGSAGGVSHRLAECVAEVRPFGERRALFIHWLILRDPLAGVESPEQCLPGQDAPGLGITEELSQMFAEAARRLALDGVAIAPAWYHTAYMVRRLMRFPNAKRQRRFQALLDVLAGVPLSDASWLVHSGRVWFEGRPYQWEADVMLGWLDGAFSPEDESARVYTPEFSVRR